MPFAATHALKSTKIDQVIVAGSFITVSSGDPTVTLGKGFTVARDGAGDYTVTLSETPGDIVAIFKDADLKTGTADYQLRTDIDDETSAAFSILLETAADINAGAYSAADDAGTRINFLVVIQNSGLGV